MPPNPAQNGSSQHWVVVHPEPSGQYSAQMVGLPELHTTAATREEALDQIRCRIEEWIDSGQLVRVETAGRNPLLNFLGHRDPNDPLEQQYLEELARMKREDLEQTLREYDQECSNSSSTPTT
jgi:predicted RNase H-like HicB family nuclease